tara:strand:+ start:100 stop:798 length:699 start_codon:yes stop_codon:yes gene_type:complete
MKQFKCGICAKIVILGDYSLGEAIVYHQQHFPCVHYSSKITIEKHLNIDIKEHNKLEEKIAETHHIFDKCEGEKREDLKELARLATDIEAYKIDLIKIKEKIINFQPNRYLTKSGEYNCEACNTTFSSMVFLEKHHKVCVEINKKDWKCSICDKQFYDKHIFNAHYKTCSNKKYCDADGCDFSTPYQEKLDSHKKKCIKLYPDLLKCLNQNCKKHGKTFATLVGRERHVCKV